MLITNQIFYSKNNVEDVRKRLNDKVCEKIQAIAKDNIDRLQGYENDTELLSKGIFYPLEYFYALKEKNQFKRLETLRKENHFFHGYACPKSFSIEKDFSSPTKKKTGSFILREGAIPSEALKNISEGLSLIGCAEVIHIVQYLAIQEILGHDKFNSLFDTSSKTPLKIGTISPSNPIYRLRTHLNKKNPSFSEIKKGDLVSFQNMELYRIKYPIGAASNYNTICVDDSCGSQKFVSLGFPAEGINSDEVNNLLMKEFNATYDNLEYLTDETKTAFYKICNITDETEKKLKIAADVQITLDDFKQFQGGHYTLNSRLDAEKITALANSPTEEAQNLLDRWKN